MARTVLIVAAVALLVLQAESRPADSSLHIQLQPGKDLLVETVSAPGQRLQNWAERFHVRRSCRDLFYGRQDV